MDCEGKCCCDGPGFCPRYGRNMTPRLWKKCQDPIWRMNFSKFFESDVTIEEEEKRLRMMRYERTQQIRKEDAKLAELNSMIEVSLTSHGVSPEQLEEGPEAMSEKQISGLGDMVESILSTVGVDEEFMNKLTGNMLPRSEGCGCNKRKSFLNKILPFMKKNNEEKETPE